MRLVLPALLLLKKLRVGSSLVLKLENRFWDKFWEGEQEIERTLAPNDAPLLPIRGSERAVFIEAIASVWPLRSVLDVGCGFGQNAHILCKLFPSIRYVGIDISAQRVADGQRELDKARIDQARLVKCDALDLSAFSDSSVDVVLSSAFLLYIEPKDLEQVLNEMCRVARKAVVLLEQHDGGASEARCIREAKRPPYWIRNYSQEFINRFSSVTMREYRVNSPRWTLEQWQRFARVFVFRVS